MGYKTIKSLRAEMGLVSQGRAHKLGNWVSFHLAFNLSEEDAKTFIVMAVSLGTSESLFARQAILEKLAELKTPAPDKNPSQASRSGQGAVINLPAVVSDTPKPKRGRKSPTLSGVDANLADLNADPLERLQGPLTAERFIKAISPDPLATLRIDALKGAVTLNGKTGKAPTLKEAIRELFTGLGIIEHGDSAEPPSPQIIRFLKSCPESTNRACLISILEA